MSYCICLIIPSLRNGGSERVMSELANHWSKKKDLEVNLILLTNQKKFYKLHPKVKVFEPSKKYTSPSFIKKFFYKLWVLYFIRRTCKKIKPDTILSFNERYNNIVLLSLFGLNLKTFVSDRNSPFKNIGKINNILRNFLYKRAYGIIAQTRISKEVLFKNTRNKNIEVIPNPLKSKKNTMKYKISKKKIILNVGRNVHQKNQLELIDIFHSCDYSNWILKIVGNGPLNEQLKSKVTKLGLNNNVKILDFNQNIDLLYCEASIFAFSSLHEGFPNVLLEAMAHGLPVISYDCQTGPCEIIKDKVNGFLVPLSEKNKFTYCLSNLMKNQELRSSISKEAKKIESIYSLEIIADKYLKFISR